MTTSKTRTILSAATVAAACTLAGFALAEPAHPETAGLLLAGATGEPAAPPAATEGAGKEAPADPAKPSGAAEQKPDAAAKPESEEAKPDSAEAKPDGAGAAPAAGGGNPLQTAESAEKGSLKSP